MAMLTTRPTVLTATVARTSTQLQALALEWNGLAGDVPFRTWQWLETWWRHYEQPGCELFTVAVRDEDNELVGVAPWYLEHTPRHGRVVRFLGSGEVCSDYLSVLCREELASPVVEQLASWLAGEGAGQWDLLELTGVEADDPAVNQLALRLADEGHTVHRRLDLQCWRTELPDDWEQFLAMLSKSRREKTRMLYRRNFANGRAVLQRAETIDDLRRGFDILIDLHQKRRKSLGQKGCFTSPRFTAFQREVAEQLFRAGRLRLLWTECEGRPVAVEYGFTGGDAIFYYQGGFDPTAADLRPGWLGFTGSLKSAIEEGYRSFDFLRGDESYKGSWRAEPHPLMQLRIVGRRPAARLRHAAWWTGEAMKHWARRSRNVARNWTSKAQGAFHRPKETSPSKSDE